MHAECTTCTCTVKLLKLLGNGHAEATQRRRQALQRAFSSGMASKACLSRLQKEYQRLSKEPLPDIEAEPR